MMGKEAEKVPNALLYQGRVRGFENEGFICVRCEPAWLGGRITQENEKTHIYVIKK